MSVYSYVRVSPKPDGPSDSLDTQEQACREYCQRNTLDLTAVFRDSQVSARKTQLADRPGGSALLAALKPNDTVVVYRLDRMFRCCWEGELTLLQWAKQKITLADSFGQTYCLATANGWLAAMQQLLYASYEPMVTAERTSRAMLYHQANGRLMSRRPPYGYKLIDGSLQTDTDELATIKQALRLRCDGQTAKQIAAALNSFGQRRRDGALWSGQSVKRLLLRHQLA